MAFGPHFGIVARGCLVSAAQAGPLVMFAHKKIIKEKGADPEPFEVDVAQAICDLEANSNDLKAELRELYIVAAKEVDVTGRKAVVIFVPFKLLKIVHKIQSRLWRDDSCIFGCAHGSVYSNE